MANIHWFLLDPTHADFAAIIAVARQRHEAVHQGAKLSVTFNVARTKALVKVDGANLDWRKVAGLNRIDGILLGKFDRISHTQFSKQFHTPEWQLSIDGLG